MLHLRQVAAGLAMLAIAGALARTRGAPAQQAPAQLPITPRDSNMQPIENAPDFPRGTAWLNTDKPLTFANELKGQVVVMDFWTYCCINCMHILPDLDALEQKYKDQPVVILGVHSAKYDNEGDQANIRAAIQRYNIAHPVLIDTSHRVWDSFDVHAWPTQVVVGSNGKIIGGISGEGHRALLEKVIDQALADGRKNGTLAAAPLKLAKEGQVRAASGLSFPGKVIADPAGPDGGRLVIVDSNHDRIVITSYPGDDGRVTVRDIIGTGKTGTGDGPFAQASFHRPQGAAISGNVLWIADTENHLIRRADLEKKTVTTVLGTGKQMFDHEAGKSGREQGLNSPWDVAVLGNRLYIAQAGQHQIFAMNLMTGMTEVAAGSSRENLRDGDAANANLAQPSGLALDAKNQVLYFADSEVSAVRALNIKTQRVETLAGQGLFTFGDEDGDADQARLQHPLGIALSADGKSVLVADTYNHRIKSIDISKRITSTLAGTGKPGTGDHARAAVDGGAVQFFEPAGLSVGKPGEVFVADTNNHRVVRLTIADGRAAPDWTELTIDGLSAPGTAGERAADPDARDAGAITIAAGQPLPLKLALKIPLLNHLTPGAPISLKVTDGTRTIFSTTLMPDTKLPLEVMLPPLSTRPAQLYVSVFYTHCSSGSNAVCTPEKSAWKMTVQYENGSPKPIELK